MTDGKIKSFTDLRAWQEAHKFAVMVYRKTAYFPPSEIYGLTNQLRRAAVSVPSNIAEGFGRHGYKEKLNFYYTSQGSLTEAKSQILIANDIDYFINNDFNELMTQANIAHALLQGLITSTKSFVNHKS